MWYIIRFQNVQILCLMKMNKITNKFNTYHFVIIIMTYFYKSRLIPIPFRTTYIFSYSTSKKHFINCQYNFLLKIQDLINTYAH